jgi:AcrR family transcriptional regulator
MESPTTPPSRREQNQAATRTAIAQAALRLLRDEGVDALTAERVADLAGVSRRTLFNYFPSVEAALNAPLETFLDGAIARFDEVPADLPATTASVEALRALGGPREGLAAVAEVFVLAEGIPQLSRLQLEAWDHTADRMHEAMSQRAPAAGRFELAVYVHAVVGAGKAAFRHWAEQHPVDYLSDAAVDDLQDHLTFALEQLRDGFPGLQALEQPAPGQD